jgi:hypothetical protein
MFLVFTELCEALLVRYMHVSVEISGYYGLIFDLKCKVGEIPRPDVRFHSNYIQTSIHCLDTIKIETHSFKNTYLLDKQYTLIKN